jgi:hypothetical protein
LRLPRQGPGRRRPDACRRVSYFTEDFPVLGRPDAAPAMGSRAAARAAPLLLEERQVGARIELREDDEPGFWEGYGYHNYGDPVEEERYAGD